ncbi:PREDICTED: cytochrome P450 72A15-like isoform X2 [Tarenaya hassleriana]|uniref:cytochrome P450 72A15-like isoform X2 n=1 Tax=Tarenaya hassleriana TaxID=28532 RepID=UPI00053C7F3F|nr:PREDICTED: cytochrome P450 72A15-like isoform X2 [Tarenaya hassleriana]
MEVSVLLHHLPLSFLLILLLYGCGRILYSIWWKPRLLSRRLIRQGIHGTDYKLLLGDMKEYIALITESWSKPLGLHHRIVQRVDPFTLSTVQKHGKVSFFWSGKTPRLIVQDPKMMKEVLANRNGHFSKPALSSEILVLTRGLTTLKGDVWSIHRRILNPAFHLEKLKEMVPIFASSCRRMIEEWKNKFGLEESYELDVWPEFQKLAADIISRAAFGSSYEEGKKVFELQNELIGLVLEVMQSLQIPGFRFIPTRKNRRRKELNKEIGSILRSIEQKKENEMKDKETARVDDLLGLMLQSNGGQAESRSMTMDEIIEECKQFYLAGQETTASLLTWAMIVLSMHPDWQEKAREEIRGFCSNKEIDFEAINRLKNLTMILQEVLRLYPPVIAQYQHAYHETRIGEQLVIPAGTDLTLPTLLIHHDHDLWGEDAEEFKPERFAEGISRASSSSRDIPPFFPFGSGPRTCIGQNFAMLEAKIALVLILQNFSFDLSPAYSHSPYTVMTLQPQHGAQIILRKIVTGS